MATVGKKTTRSKTKAQSSQDSKTSSTKPVDDLSSDDVAVTVVSSVPNEAQTTLESEDAEEEVVVTIKPSDDDLEAIAKKAADSLSSSAVRSQDDAADTTEEAAEPSPVETAPRIKKAHRSTALPKEEEPDAEEATAVAVHVSPAKTTHVIEPLEDEPRVESSAEDESANAIGAEPSIKVQDSVTKSDGVVSAFEALEKGVLPASDDKENQQETVSSTSADPTDTSSGAFIAPHTITREDLVKEPEVRDYRISKKNLKHPPKEIRQRKRASITQVIIVVTFIYLVVGALYIYAETNGIIG